MLLQLVDYPAAPRGGLRLPPSPLLMLYVSEDEAEDES